MDVIVTHANTDFDALGSLLAARKLYPGSVAAIQGSLNANVRSFVRLHAEELDLRDAGRLDLDSITRLVVVETVRAGRLGDFERVARDPLVEAVVFDHHPAEQPDWAKPENVVLSDDGALSTTMAGILAEREIAVTELEATTLALGIHEDTGSLTYPRTTLRDAEALIWCLRHGAQQEMVAHYLHAPLAPAERALFEALLAAVETHSAGGFDVLFAAVRWPDYVDGVANLAHKIADLTDAVALVCLVEMEGRVVAVVRTRVPELDARPIAEALGGGGHSQAASATFHGTLAEAREKALGALPRSVRQPVTAGQIMSRPARFVGPEETVARAMVLCQRHRQSGIQVGTPRELVGIVAREDLDKAVGHGLSHAPVKSVMSAGVPVCAEGAPLAELQRLLSASHVGRIPVVRDGEVVGIVTRGDVLQALGEPAPPSPAEEADGVRDRLLALDGFQRLFEAIQEVSVTFDGVYLVGGAVRDVLMAEPTFDVDIAVEGDGIALGRALAKELGGRAVPHEKFGTAIVVYGDGRRVDVATARTEFYDAPGALPAVEQASIRQDLFRRDFTINAMAVSLRGEDFGRLVDFFGGLRDLQQGMVRVLHNLSFIDDPTRIFRAVRYESRYGFRMDGHTLGLARSCVEMNLVGELSSSRLRDELQLLLGEERVEASVSRLADLGLDHAVHPHLAADAEALELIEDLDALRSRFAPDAPVWRLRLAVLARRLPPEELYDWFERLKLRRRDADLIADAVTVAPRLLELLAERDEPADVRALVEPHDPDGALLALARARGPVRELLIRYFEELRSVRLEISGSDLVALGLRESPRVGAILDELLRRKVNGELDGRTAELEAARALLHA